jgi:hypothetical protein
MDAKPITFPVVARQITAHMDALNEADAPESCGAAITKEHRSQCELIEQIPGKVSGRPIVRSTRILPDVIVNSYELGESLDFIHEDYARRGQPFP